MNRINLSLVSIALAGCMPEAPDTPSFQEDVLPIFAANCVRCHGVPTLGGAPTEFRLDSFENTVVTDGQPGAGTCGGEPDDPAAERVICGSRTYALLIGSRLRDEGRPMPPRFPLEEFQIETLARWVKGPQRGAPRPGNLAPTLAVEATTQVGSRVTLQVRIEDLDRDLVVGTLYARVDARDRVVGTVRSGRLAVTWDATGVTPGSYPLTAVLDDGAELHTVRLGMLDVEAP